MKNSIDHCQVNNLRWRREPDTELQDWSPTQRWLLLAMFIIALVI